MNCTPQSACARFAIKARRLPWPKKNLHCHRLGTMLEYSYMLYARLRSSSSSSLIVSRTRLSTVGDQAFPVAAARVWNSLPEHVTSAPSVAVFRSRLKTHLFDISYPDPV